MNRVLKTFFVWLLLIALPLQGYASVRSLACEPVGHHAQVTVQAGADLEMAQHHDGSKAGASHQHASHGSSTAKHGTSCHTCHACCAGAMIYAPINAVAADIRSDLPSAAPSAHFAGHIPGGLERPPRAFRI